MKKFTKSVLTLFLLLGLTAPALGQFITLDWKLHEVGKVIQIVNNQGRLNQLGTTYTGLINTRFPPQSFEEHTGGVGWYIGGVNSDGDTLVTTPFIPAFNASQELQGYSGAPWDTVYRVNRGDTMDIGDPDNPYITNYTAEGDEDIVTRYNDYNQAVLDNPDHRPMFIDVVQRSWAWASEPMDQFIIFNIDIIPQREPLYDVWLGVLFNANVGRRTGAGFSFSQDDFATYHHNYRMAIGHDAEGGPDGGKYTPIGMKLIPPDEYRGEEIRSDKWNWTWRWSGVAREDDSSHYEQMTLGQLQENQVNPSGTSWIHAFGQIDSLSVGDTLTWQSAMVLGMDQNELFEKAELIERLMPDFDVPSPPPSPELTVTPSNRTVEISWGSNSENFVDPDRSDSVEQPFEGYRVYKSTQSASGPWTLLGEFDIDNNEFGQNTGLQNKFTDSGLMNNVEYFYTVTAFSKPDTVLNFPSQESSQRANAVTVSPGTPPPEEVGEVAVVPNPYRGDIDYNAMDPPWEKPPETRERWLEQDRQIQFINLPAQSTIKIYTLSGRLVETLRHNDETRGFENWNLTSNVNQAVASGIYLFTVKNEETGNVQTGKFVIIK